MTSEPFSSSTFQGQTKQIEFGLASHKLPSLKQQVFSMPLSSVGHKMMCIHLAWLHMRTLHRFSYSMPNPGADIYSQSSGPVSASEREIKHNFIGSMGDYLKNTSH